MPWRRRSPRRMPRATPSPRCCSATRCEAWPGATDSTYREPRPRSARSRERAPAAVPARRRCQRPARGRGHGPPHQPGRRAADRDHHHPARELRAATCVALSTARADAGPGSCCCSRLRKRPPLPDAHRARRALSPAVRGAVRGGHSGHGPALLGRARRSSGGLRGLAHPRGDGHTRGRASAAGRGPGLSGVCLQRRASGGGLAPREGQAADRPALHRTGTPPLRGDPGLGEPARARPRPGRRPLSGHPGGRVGRALESDEALGTPRAPTGRVRGSHRCEPSATSAGSGPLRRAGATEVTFRPCRKPGRGRGAAGIGGGVVPRCVDARAGDGRPGVSPRALFCRRRSGGRGGATRPDGPVRLEAARDQSVSLRPAPGGAGRLEQARRASPGSHPDRRVRAHAHACRLRVPGGRAGHDVDPGRLRRVQRRIEALPAAQFSRVSYRPLSDGRAQLDVNVVERRAFSPPLSILLHSAVLAVSERAIGVDVFGLAPSGDSARLLGRWQPNRARGVLSASSPAFSGYPESSRSRRSGTSSRIEPRRPHSRALRSANDESGHRFHSPVGGPPTPALP